MALSFCSHKSRQTWANATRWSALLHRQRAVRALQPKSGQQQWRALAWCGRLAEAEMRLVRSRSVEPHSRVSRSRGPPCLRWPIAGPCQPFWPACLWVLAWLCQVSSTRVGEWSIPSDRCSDTCNPEISTPTSLITDLPRVSGDIAPVWRLLSALLLPRPVAPCHSTHSQAFSRHDNTSHHPNTISISIPYTQPDLDSHAPPAIASANILAHMDVPHH